MSQKLINRNPDLKRLQDEGYQIEVRGGYLCVHHIPYLNHLKEVKFGSLIANLELAGEQLHPPKDHVIHFAGEFPHFNDGKKILALEHSDQKILVDSSLSTSYSFSNRPPNGFSNYYDKLISYIKIISHQAISVNQDVTVTPFLPIIDNVEENIFNYVDTNSSRANINSINAKFTNHKIAIVGLGGTGAYILDLVSKTKVSEIHIFDGDTFLVHNSFRSPGAASIDDLNSQIKKAEYYQQMYSKMRKEIHTHCCYIKDENVHDLDLFDFVFICIDDNNARKIIIDHLLAQRIPFIDVGMGVYAVDDKLLGSLRVTLGTVNKQDHLMNRIPMGDDNQNEYKTNIQIADLNCLNATLAVIKWKKFIGFYQDYEQEYNATYSINVAQLLNEDLQIDS